MRGVAFAALAVVTEPAVGARSAPGLRAAGCREVRGRGRPSGGSHPLAVLPMDQRAQGVIAAPIRQSLL
jgi:hypothetical protein